MNNEIIIRDNEAILRINYLFYPYEAVAKAAAVATDKLWVNIEGGAGGILSITLKPKKPGMNMKEVSDEFMNLVLMVMKNR